MAQIRFTFKGLRFSVSEKFWKIIKERFNIKNAKLGMKVRGRWEIWIACPLCERYGGIACCVGCTFDKYLQTPDECSQYSAGCVEMIREVLGQADLGTMVFNPWADHIFWSDEDDELARKQMRVMHKWLSEKG